MKQKLFEHGSGDTPPSHDNPVANPDAAKAAQAGNDLLKRLEEAQKPKARRGRYVECCGVRTWIED